MNPFRATTLPPIFVVTLAEQPWKRLEATKHFQSLKLDPAPVFIDGLHGPSVALRPIVPFNYNERGENLYMHSTAIGCVLSHRIALSAAIASTASEFIICEDDVLFAPDFVLKFRHFRSAIDDETNVAQLEWQAAPDSKLAPLTPESPVSKISPFPFRSACIWWKRTAAREACRLLMPFNQPYDVLLIERVFPHLGHVVASPPLARQRSVEGEWPSDIGPVTDENNPQQ